MGIDEILVSDEIALIALACAVLAIAIALVLLLTNGQWNKTERSAADAAGNADDVWDEAPANSGEAVQQEPVQDDHAAVRVTRQPAPSAASLITHYHDCPIVLDAERLYVDKRWTPPDDEPLIRCADRLAFLTDFELGDWVQERVNAFDLLAVQFSDYAFELHRARALSPDIEARLSARTVDLWLKRQATYAKYRYEDGTSHEVLFYPCVEIGPAAGLTAEAEAWLDADHLLADPEDGPYAAPDYAAEHNDARPEPNPTVAAGEASPEEALSAASAQLNALEGRGAEERPIANDGNGSLSTPRAATSALLGALHCEIVPLRHIVNVTFELVDCQKIEGLFMVETRQWITEPGDGEAPGRQLCLNRYHYFLPAPGGGLLVRLTLPDAEDSEASAAWLARWLNSLRVILPSAAPIAQADAAEPAPALT